MAAWNRYAVLATCGKCVLYPQIGDKAVRSPGKRNTYWGVCREPGLEQEQRFVGTFAEVRKKFEAWAKSMPHRMEINAPVRRVTKRKEESDMQEKAKGSTTSSKSTVAMPEKVYALAYKRGSTVRYVMAFANDNDALDAAEVSGKALEIAGVDGEYTVDELTVRW